MSLDAQSQTPAHIPSTHLAFQLTSALRTMVPMGYKGHAPLLLVCPWVMLGDVGKA